MNRCLITYAPCGENLYSNKGLKLLSPRLTSLKPFPYTKTEQLHEAMARATKMSIQGVQPKLSARLNLKDSVFEPVDQFGEYIIKPPSDFYPELPENEDLTMRLAAVIGIEVPLHGLLYAKDGSRSYFIKRFDRLPRKRKVHQEDFAQLSGNTRETKYSFSMERVGGIIETYCTFPLIEKQKLFKLTLFSFLVGNEDMHLKNFSLLRRNDKIELSPAYDLLNTTIAVPNASEELALPLAGKKNKLTRELLVDYFGRERLNLSEKVIEQTESAIRQGKPKWLELISIGFLTERMRLQYLALLEARWARIFHN